MIKRLTVISGSLAVFVFGVLLALMTHVPMFGFLQGASQNWLLLANILLFFDILAVPVIFIPHGKKFEPILQEALAIGPVTPHLRTALDDPFVRVAH